MLVEPGARVDVRAVDHDADVQVGAGGLATVADLGDLVPGLHLLTDGDERLDYTARIVYVLIVVLTAIVYWVVFRERIN